MVKLQSLLPNSKKFLKKLKIVKINKANIPVLAQNLINPKLVFKESKKLSFLPPIFYLLTDGLNFCFWNIDERKKFRYKNKTGSVALGLKIKENLKFTSADFLYKNPTKFYYLLLKNTEGELLLKDQRIRIIKEIGRFLNKYNLNKIINNFYNKDIDLVADFFEKNLLYTFGDKNKKFGIELNFYKKLRLFLSDLIALGGFKFKNKEKLLVFVDSELPRVFLSHKILILDPKAEKKIFNDKFFKQGAIEEISWRAGAVICAFELKKYLSQFFYPEIDRRLWLYSKKISFPKIRVLSRFY